jgi:hypothetical protein
VAEEWIPDRGESVMFGSQMGVVTDVLAHSPKGGGPPKWFVDVYLDGPPRPDTEEEAVARKIMGDDYPRLRRIPLFRITRLRSEDGTSREG